MKDDNVRRLAGLFSGRDRVLDVGGWYSPFNRADAVIDFMPYETRNRAGAVGADRFPDERFTRDSYFQRDICGPDPWPFADKEFDFAICSHTLEDIRDPVFVCRELNRVARAGYIEVPSRLVESTRGVERPFYCGYYHHRWLCETEGTSIRFLFKPAMLSAYRRFHFRKPFYKKVNPELDASFFFWTGSFGYAEKILIDRDEVQRDLVEFKRRFSGRRDLFVSKYTLDRPRATPQEELDAIVRRHATLLRRRRILGKVMGSAGRRIPWKAKRWLARRTPRFAHLFLADGDFQIADYQGDIKVHIDARSQIEREMLSGGYEPDAVAYLRRTVRAGDVCLDVGANVGAVALVLAQSVGSGGRVVCVEPGPPFLERLRSNFSLNPQLTPRAEFHGVGLSDVPGELGWEESAGFAGNGWLLGEGGEKVPVVTLDALVQQLGLTRLDFVKIDVEGMETEVIAGGRVAIGRFMPTFLLETSMEFEAIRRSPVRRRLVELLEGLGYELFAVGAGGALTPCRYPNLPALAAAVHPSSSRARDV